MNHRHLLPNEIDLLVDGDAGFGVAPLRAHLDTCAACRERLDEALVVAEALEALPHFAPDSRLADRVMAQVPIFVPVHVAARDSVARWMPRSSGARALAIAVGAALGGLLTLALVWLGSRADAVLFMGSILGDRIRGVMSDAGRHLVVSLLGQSALTALQSIGPVGTSLLILGVVLAAGGTVAGLRRVATASAGRQ